MDEDDATAEGSLVLVAELVELLRGLPTREVLRWGTASAEADGWIAGWCDVWAPELARPLGWSWVWTVCGPASECDGPLYIELPGAARSDDGDVGWSAATVSRAIEAWVAHHTGRTDLTFAFDQELIPDWTAAFAARAGEPEDPLGETVDGLLHDLVELEGRVVAACGADLGTDWVLRSNDMLITGDEDDDELDWELSRDCAECAELRP